MQFLKKEIFYPIDGRYDDEKICLQRKNYVDYLDSIRDALPKNLLRSYDRAKGFHDYCVKSICVHGTAWCYFKRSDVIDLDMFLYEDEISLQFSDLSYLKLLNENKDGCWTEVKTAESEKIHEEENVGLEEIVLCEIGLVGNNKFRFEFITSSGAVFEVHFGKVKVGISRRRN